jgi:hypothetical protein
LEATGHGNMSEWAEHQPAYFWSAADRYERANGTAYREIEIALPRELNPEQRRGLVEDFIHQEISARHANNERSTIRPPRWLGESSRTPTSYN